MDNGREDKNPWSKWYWSDWLSDAGVRASSLMARGLWIEMLAIMSKAKRKGYLLDGESKMESKTLARLVGEPVEVINGLLDELKKHDVYSIDSNGIIFNRRMIREKDISLIRSEAGRLGGRPKSKMKAKHESKTKAPSASAYASASVSIRFNKNLRDWEGITQEDKDGWKEAYPACEIDIELAKMREWILSNPAKGKKSNYRRFISGWLTRAQDSGGTKGDKGGGGVFQKSTLGDNLPPRDTYKQLYEKHKAERIAKGIDIKIEDD
jgi:hypothetical protein